MKTRGFRSTLFAIMAVYALQLTISTAPAASNKYSAQLLSPVAGQVLYAGQKIMAGGWTFESGVKPPHSKARFAHETFGVGR